MGFFMRPFVVRSQHHPTRLLSSVPNSLGHDHVWAKSQEEARHQFAVAGNTTSGTSGASGTSGGGFHYVLLDLSIPVQSGRGLDSIEYGTNLAKEIHQSPSMQGVPIIVMTAYGKDGLEFAAPLCDYGVKDFINKPFPRTGRTLASVIQSVLERTRRKHDPVGATHLKPDKPFQDGELIFYTDRVELCGVTVLSSGKSNQMWTILDKLKDRLNEHRYRAFPGSALAGKGGQGGVAGSIRDFRRHMAEQIGRELGLKVEPQDMIETSNGGYRLNARINVKDLRTAKSPRIKLGAASDSKSDALTDVSDDEKLRQERILEMIRSGERLRMPKIAEKLRCSYSTAKRAVDGLKAENRIAFVGPSKTGCYEIVPAELPAKIGG